MLCKTASPYEGRALEQPWLARDVHAGRYFLADAPTGDRETLVTAR